MTPEAIEQIRQAEAEMVTEDGRRVTLRQAMQEYYRDKTLGRAQRAVLAERERCAKVLEALPLPEDLAGDTRARMLARAIWYQCRQAGAAKIRSGE